MVERTFEWLVSHAGISRRSHGEDVMYTLFMLMIAGAAIVGFCKMLGLFTRGWIQSRIRKKIVKVLDR
jgi:hypothetical protein